MQMSQAETGSTVGRIAGNDVIKQNMVDAATKLYNSAFFRGWHVSNAALEKLSSDLRNDWSEASCLLKAVAVNELYGTNVSSTEREYSLSSVVATSRDMSSFIAPNDNPVRPHLSPGYPHNGG